MSQQGSKSTLDSNSGVTLVVANAELLADLSAKLSFGNSRDRVFLIVSCCPYSSLSDRCTYVRGGVHPFAAGEPHLEVAAF